MSAHAEIFGLALALHEEGLDDEAATARLVTAAAGRPTVLLAAHAHARALARELPHDANLSDVTRRLTAAVQRAAENPEVGPVVNLGLGRDRLAEAETVALARKALSDLARG